MWVAVDGGGNPTSSPFERHSFSAVALKAIPQCLVLRCPCSLLAATLRTASERSALPLPQMKLMLLSTFGGLHVVSIGLDAPLAREPPDWYKVFLWVALLQRTLRPRLRRCRLSRPSNVNYGNSFN